ncbi:MAG TPA: SurA N-terminal domain-containing protein [Xanthobacteraceae bacterium]|nr:SurA N-terminal domain-containing protein [Xanthobacteraceae bacterium]
MLRGIHKATANWLGKIIMTIVLGTLVVSFAIWGIGDIFRGFGRSALAKVGGVEIGVEQFRQVYMDRVQQIGRQLGRPMTMDQARALGFDQQVLGEMIAKTAIDQRAHQLGLGISDEDVARHIMADPSFQGASGTFDRALFESLIRQAGYTEQRFVSEQREQMVRAQIFDTVSGDVVVPKSLVELAYRHASEERAVEYVVLGRAQAGQIPQPTPEMLAKYFDERKALFQAPEYRKLTIVEVTPEEVAKKIAVSDADAKQVFAAHPERYSTPERRHVEQIVFPDAQAAQAAADSIAKGLSFDALVKQRQLQPKDVDLGTVAKSDMVDQEIANAAFSLKEGGVSGPVKGRFGTALVHVLKIEPGETRSYEQVASQIKQDLALERARTQLSDLRNKLEDARAAGDSLTEAAQKLGLKATTVDAVDRAGKGPDGKPVDALRNATGVVPAAFATEVGVENDPLQLPNGGALWYDVLGVSSAHERKLDEVKTEVEIQWTNDEIAKRLQEKANAMLTKLKAGAALKDVAAAEGLAPLKASGLKRGDGNETFPAQAIDSIFRTAKDQAGAAQGQQPVQRIVFRVTDVKTPALDMNSPDAKRIENATRTSKTNELLGQYVSQLESELGVSINQAALSQIAGGEANPN